jgi:MEMO1 family protein
VTAPTVVIVGVFHRYRQFQARDSVVFDPYRAWRTPDGPAAVSPLREEILARMPQGQAVQSAAMHDSEHSVEALVYWLRHGRPDLQIVPLLVPAAGFERLQKLASEVGVALADSLRKRGWILGRDVAIVISADAVHYGADFHHVPFGEGGVEAYQQATARDRALLTGPLAGEITVDKTYQLFSTFVDPSDVDTYRLPWCGRFSVPFGLLLLRSVASTFALGKVVGRPIAYGTSIESPELDVRGAGLGQTAAANLYHFVGHPAVGFTVEK